MGANSVFAAFAHDREGGVEAATAPAVTFRAGPPETVVDHATRVDGGLRHWVDGTMGIHRHGGATTVIAPNGGRLARHDLTMSDFAAGPRAADARIRNQVTPSDHASGGPLHYDERSGQLLLAYHGETFSRGDPADFYAFIGLAVSDDHGETFDDLGRIITSHLDEGDRYRPRPVDVGSGAFVVRDGWFLAYFQDRGNGPTRRRLSVARARVDDVVAAARDRRTPVFAKYHDGRWDQPGCGGVSAELLDHVPWVVWFDTAVLEPLGCVLLVYSTSWLVDGVPHWMHLAALSPDGLRWSTPVPLLGEPVTDEIIYLTIDSGGPDQRTITGSSFDVYRTRSSTPERWDHAWLERVPVTFEPVTVPADGPVPDGVAGNRSGAPSRAGAA
jgi:hypothetical protein